MHTNKHEYFGGPGRAGFVSLRVHSWLEKEGKEEESDRINRIDLKERRFATAE